MSFAIKKSREIVWELEKNRGLKGALFHSIARDLEVLREKRIITALNVK